MKAKELIEEMEEKKDLKDKFENQKKKVVDLVLKAVKISQEMEGDSMSGQKINNILGPDLEEIKKVKFKPWR